MKTDTNTTTEQDPLSVAASSVDTSFPVLVGDRVIRCEVANATVGPAKEHPDRQVLTIKLKTTKDCKQTDGKTAKPGFPLFKRIGLTPTPATEDRREYSIEDVKKALGTVLKALGGEFATKPLTVLRDDPASIVGQVVDVRTSVQKASGSFPESNTVTFVIPA